MNFTKNQQKAVTGNFDKNVLVSASAGAGKTSVLVSRVVNKLIEQHPWEIDEFIIVTFTKAAAEEMQQRIEDKIVSKIAELKTLKKQSSHEKFLIHHLERQLHKLPLADIETMDAFCNKLVKKYYYRVGIDPNFNILNDSLEKKMLRREVWERVSDNFYYQHKDKHFLDLVDNFPQEQQNKPTLMNLVFNVYDFANIHSNPNEWLNGLTNNYHLDNQSFTKTSFYNKLLKKIIIDELLQIQVIIKQALTLAEANNLDKEGSILQSDLADLASLQANLVASTNDWNKLRTMMTTYTFKRFSGGKKTEEQIKEIHNSILSIRNQAKAQFEGLVNNYFYLDEADNAILSKSGEALVAEVMQLVKKFSQTYNKVKRERHVYEFIDIEHLAFDILTNQNGNLSEVGKEVKTRINEIIVDEYQDNNLLQDKILRKLSKDNIFMVGDIKQSIYRFRLAKPDMFKEKLQTYSLDDNKNTVIPLRENFRSQKNIINFTNDLFAKIMDSELGEIEYNDPKMSHFLTLGASYPKSFHPPVQVLLYNHNDTKQGLNGNNIEKSKNSNDMPVSTIDGEAEILAQKIRLLVDNHTKIYDVKANCMRAMTYDDIAILSPTRTHDHTLREKFKEYNIPLNIASHEETYFQTMEIQIMQALLSIIDNPHNDIDLVAVLRSPLVGLNENQLVDIKLSLSNKGDFFERLKNFAKNNIKDQKLNKKVKNFLQWLNKLQDFSKYNSVADLIGEIYKNTNFLDIVSGMPNGQKRKANLNLLYKRANDYDTSEGKSKNLFSFISFIKKLKLQGGDFPEAGDKTAKNEVKAMTIHASKGLEFPVVFLFNFSNKFNKKDYQDNTVVLNDDLGIGVSKFYSKVQLQLPTLQKKVVEKANYFASLSEEMRQLYVAVTRAKQYLYVIGGTNKTPEELQAKWHPNYLDNTRTVLPAYLRHTATSFLDWIGMATVNESKIYNNSFSNENTENETFSSEFTFFDGNYLAKEKENYKKKYLDNIHSVTKLAPSHGASKKLKDNNKLANETKKKINQVINFQYPTEELTQTPSYQSVSEIKNRFYDPDIKELPPYQQKENNFTNSKDSSTDLTIPDFIKSKAVPSATEIGTATHLVLQKIDLHLPVTISSIKKLISKLVKDKLITPEVAVYIKVDNIYKFFESDLGKLLIKHVNTLRREVPFSLIISPNLKSSVNFTSKYVAQQKQLVHGIIDGYVELNDGSVLVDYKTDRISSNYRDKDIMKIKDKYKGQLNLYGKALEQMTNKPVLHKYLYLLSIHEAIEV